MVITLTYFFYVNKGTYDICMVFEATVSGLNNSLWDPKFMLLPMGSLLMMLGPETHIVNIDVGEMFYNFRISSMLSKYCRVDLGSYLWNKKDCNGTPLSMRWVHFVMGLVLYPYATIQGLLWAIEVVRGYMSDPDNPFRWEMTRLNLPGNPSYSPTITWMSKVRWVYSRAGRRFYHLHG